MCTGGSGQYSNLVLRNWTTCTTTGGNVLARVTAQFTGRTPPTSSYNSGANQLWKNMSAPGYPPAGIYQFVPGINQGLRWSTVADKAEGQKVSDVLDAARDGLGWTLMANVLMARPQCSQSVMYNRSVAAHCRPAVCAS